MHSFFKKLLSPIVKFDDANSDVMPDAPIIDVKSSRVFADIDRMSGAKHELLKKIAMSIYNSPDEWIVKLDSNGQPYNIHSIKTLHNFSKYRIYVHDEQNATCNFNGEITIHFDACTEEQHALSKLFDWAVDKKYDDISREESIIAGNQYDSIMKAIDQL